MRSSLPLLTAAECGEAADCVLGLRRFWTRRHEELPSFTLGAACYLDVAQHGPSTYFRNATRGNTLLKRRFAWLYQRLAVALSEKLGGETVYTDRFALPGFHIYEGHERLTELEPIVHFDLQDLRLEWQDDEKRVPGGRVSYTIPISIPAGGTGLYIWDITHEETSGLTEQQAEAQFAHRERHYIAYELGNLVIHSGDQLHQIANRSLPEVGESRITLQGHGRRSDDRWELYW